MQGHIFDLADAYALGTLHPTERLNVDDHVRVCASCSAALGAAEETVSALVEATTPIVQPPARLRERIARSAHAELTREKRMRIPMVTAWGSLAAALVISLSANLGLWDQSSHLRAAATHSDAVLATLATSHFRHVTLDARSAGVPTTKALYAPDRSWIYVIMDAPSCDCRVVAGDARGLSDLGTPQRVEKTSTLFAGATDHPQTIALVDPSGKILASADLK
jgi:hypothetical protein